MLNSSALVIVGAGQDTAAFRKIADVARDCTMHLSVLVTGILPSIPVYSYPVSPYGTLEIPQAWHELVEDQAKAASATADTLREVLAEERVETDIRVLCAEQTGLQAFLSRRALSADIVVLEHGLRQDEPLFRSVLQAAVFNAGLAETDDDLAPVMITLRDQNGLGMMLDLSRMRSSIIITIFIVVMSIVLWNTGLMSGIRRYGEFGVRLAIGESKPHVYLTLIGEAVLIGITGSAAGMALGLSFSYFLQEVGWDISGMLQGSSVMISNVIRARVSLAGGLIGLVPGLAATILGAVFSGANIFRRQTSQLFKELEV